MACMMDSYVTVVISTEDTNGNGVLDRGEDLNGNRELDIETETRGDGLRTSNGSSMQHGKQAGHTHLQRGNVTAETLCNDNEEASAVESGRVQMLRYSSVAHKEKHAMSAVIAATASAASTTPAIPADRSMRPAAPVRNAVRAVSVAITCFRAKPEQVSRES